MKNFKKSHLAAALALGLAAGGVQAANVTAEGIGELVYIPYYSTIGNQETNFRLVNTSDKTVTLKVMFREGKSSLEVRDFNVTMSPYDVWSGSIQASGATGAKITTSDTTCTSPDKNQWVRNNNGSYSVDFVDRGGIASKPNEGYVVVRVLGVSDISTNTVNSVPYLAKHVNGAPRDCGAIDWGYANAFDSIQGQFREPMNVLAASASLVDAANGLATSIPVTVLANVNNPLGTDGLGNYGNNIINVPNQESLETTADDFAVVFEGDTAIASSDSFATGSGHEDITAALMQDTVINSFDVTNSSWVITFPTKRAHGTGAVAPFSAPYPVSGLIEISPSYVDDEEIAFSAGTQFSPAQSIPTINLPNEVNVLTFNGNNLLGSGLTTNLSIDNRVSKGWLELDFTNSNPLSGATVTLDGLPAIGFNYTEGSESSISTAHSYTKSVR
jgi:hypothetical protein